MTKKTVYIFHPLSMEFLAKSVAFESPEEPDIFLMPAFSTDIEPSFEDGKITKWNGEEWVLEDVPEAETPSEEELLQTAKNERLVTRYSYLSGTDRDVWTFVELVARGLSPTLDSEIATNRDQARSDIASINSAMALEDLEEISVEFP